jgi:hypothetical protein
MDELMLENQRLREKVVFLQNKLLLFGYKDAVEQAVEKIVEETVQEVIEETVVKDVKDDVFCTKQSRNFYASLRPLTKKEIQYIHRYIEYLKLFPKK